MPLIAALLTCFNRREKTLECLRRLTTQKLPAGIRIEVFLVDDGSTDGTSNAVSCEYPAVHILRGDGSLYWCGGMRLAWREAAVMDPDYYLLANDDTLLDGTSLASLLAIAQTPASRVIAVASIRDPDSGVPSYGGIRDVNGLVPATGEAEHCDTFNGNAVLVPRQVYLEIGMLHPAYTHGMGDFDYGLTARRNGIDVIQTPLSVGTCARNPVEGTWRDKSLSRRARWRMLHSPKGLPFREWMIYNRRNSGWMWPLRTITPSIRVIMGL